MGQERRALRKEHEFYPGDVVFLDIWPDEKKPSVRFTYLVISIQTNERGQPWATAWIYGGSRKNFRKVRAIDLEHA